MLFTACIEEFEPEVTKYENLLVVDGMITNEPGPYLVKLSRSYPYDEYNAQPVRGAMVQLIDEDGNTESLSENSPGKYYTAVNGMKGIPGKSYKIYILTASGDEYESDFEKLKSVPPIDSVFWVIETNQKGNIGKNVSGLQFYVNTHDPQNKTKYYRYEWKETWEIRVPYIKPEWPDRITCWKNSSFKNIVITNSEGLKEDKIANFPVFFVPEGGDRFYIKYSLLMTQFSLTQNAYKYLDQLEKYNENMGTLFDPVPTAVKGNVVDMNDESIPVLGFFMASGITTKRIFVKRDEIPRNLNMLSGFEHCRIFPLYNEDELNAYLRNGYIFLYFDTDMTGNDFLALSNHLECADCTVNGSKQKPDFWDDDEK